MIVLRIDRATTERTQCQLHRDQLREVGWRGYRERRARHSGRDHTTCMRDAAWIVDDQALCSQHAGLALEYLEKNA